MGLVESEAKLRLERDGPDLLSSPGKTPEWLRFLKVMFSGFAALLWAAAILCFVATAMQAYHNLDNGIALVIVVVVTVLFTYYQ